MSSTKPRFLWGTTLIQMTYSPNVLFALPVLPSFKSNIFLSMRSYTTLAVLVLAASMVSPALSAPVRYDGLHLRIRFLAFLTHSILLLVEKYGSPFRLEV